MDARIGPASMIDEFFDGYRSEQLDRRLTPGERSIAEEVLFDFLTIDQQSDTLMAPLRLIGDLRQLIPSLSGEAAHSGRRCIDQLEQHVATLAATKRRLEMGNDIMREHLAMLSTRA